MNGLYKILTVAGLLCASHPALAITPTDILGGALGVASGNYRCEGVLHSKFALIPNLTFISIRSLGDGEINAKTTASLLGIAVATAHANLKVQALSARDFDLLDLDSGRRAGGGTCDESSCALLGKLKRTISKLELTPVENRKPLYSNLIEFAEIHPTKIRVGLLAPTFGSNPNNIQTKATGTNGSGGGSYFLRSVGSSTVSIGASGRT